MYILHNLDVTNTGKESRLLSDASVQIVSASLTGQYANSLKVSVRETLPVDAQRHSLDGVEKCFELRWQKNQQ